MPSSITHGGVRVLRPWKKFVGGNQEEQAFQLSMDPEVLEVDVDAGSALRSVTTSYSTCQVARICRRSAVNCSCWLHRFKCRAFLQSLKLRATVHGGVEEVKHLVTAASFQLQHSSAPLLSTCRQASCARTSMTAPTSAGRPGQEFSSCHSLFVFCSCL